MEKRRFKRVSSDYNIKINVIKNDESKVIDEGKTINISACGVLLKYSKPLEIGSIINVRFYNEASKDSFESIAKVVRVEMNDYDNSYDIGINFINLEKEKENKLNTYLINSEQEQTEEENCYYIEIEIPEELLITQNK
jgi:c-di-GMP-binding flagellar brake protein YcgR